MHIVRIPGSLALLAAVGLFLVAMRPAVASYEAGVDAFQRGDYAKALEEWLPEAEAGNAMAQHNVAIIFETGAGLPQKDPGAAAKWYERAAAQGVPAAQNNLGLMASQGRGVKQDMARAIELWQQASASGHAMAEYNLALMYADGKGVPQDTAKAIELLQSSAAQNFAGAQYSLGQMYRLGVGVQKDEAEARRWYSAAARQGHREAIQILSELPTEPLGSSTAAAPAAAPAPATAPTPTVASAPAPSPPASKQTASVPAATDAATSPPAGYRVWLASLPSRKRAERQWREMQGSYGDLLQGLDLSVAEVRRDDRTYYRVLAGPVSDRDAGRALCRQLQSRDPDVWCKVVTE
jgi:TPR repeat protein